MVYQASFVPKGKKESVVIDNLRFPSKKSLLEYIKEKLGDVGTVLVVPTPKETGGEVSDIGSFAREGPFPLIL